MKTSLLILTLLAAPVLAGAAADPAATYKPATPPVHAHAALVAAKQRNAVMGACQKEAAEKGLHYEERKLFLVACVNAKI